MKKEEPDRAARLADALRANLRRRKAQGREQAIGPVSPRPDPAPERADTSATATNAEVDGVCSIKELRAHR